MVVGAGKPDAPLGIKEVKSREADRRSSQRGHERG